MDPVSNVDRLVLLLRQRLDERARSAGARSEPRQPDPETAAGSPDALHALAALESVTDRQLKRALVQSILRENLGPSLVNDASFQQVVDRVTETLEGEAAASRLLSRVTTALREAAR